MCWLLGPLENPSLASSRQRCPVPGQPEVVVTAKLGAMETVVQPPERAAGEPGSCCQLGQCILGLPSSRTPCCPVVLGLGSLWTRKLSFLQGDPRARSPLSCQETPCWPLVPAATFQPPFPLKAASSWAQLAEGVRRWPGCSGVGIRAGLGLPSVNSAVCAPRAWPGLSWPAGPPTRGGSRRFWGRKTETNPVFSRLPGF